MKKLDSSQENERTTAVGFYNYAVSYRASAELLARTEIEDVTHPNAPIERDISQDPLLSGHIQRPGAVDPFAFGWRVHRRPQIAAPLHV